MRRLLVTTALTAALIVPAAVRAQPEVVSDGPEAVELLLFPQMVMVTETRTVHLPAGRSVVRFRGVAERIASPTAVVEGLQATLVEQNFDYDLMSPAALISASAGREVDVARTNPATGRAETRRAVVRSGDLTPVLDFGDQVEALGCDALPERIIFSDLADELTDSPTLSAIVDSPTAGPRTVRLSYIAFGLGWEAAYVARMSPDGEALDLSSWVILRNESGSTFSDAPVQLLAGGVSFRTRPIFIRPLRGRETCWERDPDLWRSLVELNGLRQNGNSIPMEVLQQVEVLRDGGGTLYGADAVAGVVNFVVRQPDVGDYKLYALPFPTDVAAHQTKQLALFEREDVAFEERLSFRYFSAEYPENEGPRPASRSIVLDNVEADGLGLPLPRGQFLFSALTEEGDQIFLGEGTIPNVAEGRPVTFFVGQNDLVQASRTTFIIGDDFEDGAGPGQMSVTVTLTNSGSRDAEVSVEEGVRVTRRTFAVVAESQPREETAPLWKVSVPAHGETTLSYTLAWSDIPIWEAAR